MEQRFNRVTQLLDRIAGCVLGLSVAFCTLNVLMRYFWRPIPGTFEIISYLMAVVVSFALAHCGVKKSHIAVEFVIERLPSRTQLIVGGVTDILFAGFLAVASWRSVIYAMNIYHSGELSPTLNIPFYPFIFVVAVGLLMLCIVYIFSFLARLIKGTK